MSITGIKEKIIDIKAPAKINLSLRVLNKRADGYHNIETVFLSIDVWDLLRIRLTTDRHISLKVENSTIPSDESNLCYQAAAMVSRAVKNFPGCEIVLQKKIPVGAGLGGGSSDAAAVLISLNELLGYPLGEKKIFNMAVKLGADVPFFLQHGAALGTGMGEKLQYFNVGWNFWILLLCPNFLISTSWAYSNLKMGLTNEEKNIILKGQIWQDIQVDVFYKVFENDFEQLVFFSYPELKKMKRKLYDCGAVFA
ncbi:MAG TPA: 4-(cytidine 5'-diphospho)-2-C-methyl-D-erythritol kinase, partial [Bacteroidetes bacterium]|nr:4-(cytidine 5'-diphospho)-2-C-methyl-D-erythritol kinase [Bacteroidota bacterium]